MFLPFIKVSFKILELSALQRALEDFFFSFFFLPCTAIKSQISKKGLPFNYLWPMHGNVSSHVAEDEPVCIRL